MLNPALAIRAFSLERWIGLPAARARCVRHFLVIAATLAAAKVLLSTIGVAMFVAEQGAAGLPPFYVGFAAIAILLSFGLSSIIDRASKVRLAQTVFAGLLLATAALRLLMALEVPGVSFALLASATAFEIVLDIVFWVVVAAYLDAFEFRRATPFVYLALAAGGAAGGVIARAGALVLPPADLLLLLLPFAALVVAQFGAVGSQLREVPENHPEAAEPAHAGHGVAQLGRLLQRYPLALLIALNALVVTLLYGLSEFLVLSIYEARFASEVELVEFLSLLFAFMQVVEFGLLYTLTRMLLERTGPLVRNLAFPLTSFGSLIYLVLNPKLGAAIAVHVNIEAISNALFLPINNANYVPLPLRLQGQARTLSEGIFYPVGLALAGVVLWNTDPDAATLQAQFAAVVFAALFVLLSVGVGLFFLPTLRAKVHSGPITSGHAVTPAALAAVAPRVKALLRSRDAELRLLGLALARDLDPEEFGDDLLALAARPDPAARPELARLVATAPERWGRRYVDACLASGSEDAVKLALLVLLIRRAPVGPQAMARVLRTRDPAVVALGRLAAEGAQALAQIEPLIRSAEVASELVDAVVCAGRIDCAPPLLACLARVGPQQQRRALVMLRELEAPPEAVTVARHLAQNRDATVRAEAIATLGHLERSTAVLGELGAALEDPDARVRRRAAEALCPHGDRAAAALLRPRLGEVAASSADVVWVLARIGSPRARKLLGRYMRQLQEDAERTAWLLDRIGALPNRARWSALELCLHAHQDSIVNLALTALSPASEPRVARRLRNALQGTDQRDRASAFELLAAGSQSRLVPGAADLLRYLLFGDGATAPRASRSEPGQRRDMVDEATASLSPWVRRAAALLGARAASLEVQVGTVDQDRAGDRAMAMSEQDFERIVALKSTPIFRYVPFETLVEVSRAVRARTYEPGEDVVAGGAVCQDLLILQAGALSIGDGDGAETLTAPACFGETALAGDRVSCPSVTALTDSLVLFLPAALFQELCHDHPELAMELCKLLVRRLHKASGPDLQ